MRYWDEVRCKTQKGNEADSNSVARNRHLQSVDLAEVTLDRLETGFECLLV